MITWLLTGVFGASGHAAFLDPDVNKALKKVLNEWGKYLQVCQATLNECRVRRACELISGCRRPSRQRSWGTIA